MSFNSQSSSDDEQGYHHQQQQPPPNAGYSAYGNPPQGYQAQQPVYVQQYPVQGYPQPPPPPPPQPQPQIIYTQAPPPQRPKNQQSAGCLTGCLAAIGCCFIIDYCCMPYDD